MVGHGRPREVRLVINWLILTVVFLPFTAHDTSCISRSSELCDSPRMSGPNGPSYVTSDFGISPLALILAKGESMILAVSVADAGEDDSVVSLDGTAGGSLSPTLSGSEAEGYC